MIYGPAERPHRGLLDHFLPAVIAAAAFATFAQTIRFGFVYDDRLQVLQNPLIHSWRYLPLYFTSNVWSFKAGFLSNYYRPLFLVWLRMNEALFGLRPAGWHLTSVLIHIVVTLEVYWLGATLLQDRLQAGVGAFLFGIHPIHTESVAWVSGVPDPLVAALMLASLLAYLRFRDHRTGRRLWFVASLILYALATLCKETALVFPLLLFAYEWIWSKLEVQGSWKERLNKLRESVPRLTPYLGVSVVYVVARVRALGTLAMVQADVSTRTTFLTWPSMLWFYTQKLIWPVGLSPHYDIPYVRQPSLRNFAFPGGMVVIVVGLLWLWARSGTSGATPQLQRSCVRAFASVWIGIPLLTLLNLSAFPTDEFVKDRYLYVPSIGAAWLAATVWQYFRDTNGGVARRVASGVVTGAGCVILCGLTMFQTSFWANDLVLFARAYAIAPRNPFALGNMALGAFQQGYPFAALNLLKQAVEVDPANSRLYYNKAIIELDLGQLEDCNRDLLAAIRLSPNDATALFALGKLRYREGRLRDAADIIRYALEFNPDAPDYHFTLGAVLERTGDMQGALQEYNLELAAHPGTQDVRQAILRVQRLAGNRRPDK